MAINVASEDQFSLGAIGDIEASMDSMSCHKPWRSNLLHMERLSSHANQ